MSSPDHDPLATTATPTPGEPREDTSDGGTERPSSADPERIGRFVVTRRLGSGAMGIVLEGRDDVLDRRVAIKLIAPERATSREARDRMLREAQALAKLSHPNVIPVYEAGTHDGQIFAAMEYVEGRTLRDVVEADRPPWRALVAAYIQAAKGLCSAHDAGLVHRDFKPDNAMLGADGRVRVLDFGLVAAGGAATGATRVTVDDAGDSARLTRTGATMGTPAYMAPEQFRNETVDARADQFAFCVALHEAVFGARPHNAEGLAALAFAVIEGNIDVPARREPRWLYRVLRRGLSTDPANRWPDLHALVAELERGLGRRRRAVVAGAVALSAIALVVGSRLVLAPSVAAPEAVEPAASETHAPEPPAYATARQVTRVSDDVQIAFGIGVSEDGESVAYWRSHNNAMRLAIASTQTGLETIASGRNVEYLTGPLRFLPSGELLTFGLEKPATIELVAWSPTEPTLRRVREIRGFPEGAAPPESSAISPTGEAIAVLDPATRELFVVSADGTTQRVVSHSGFGLELSWSPDGSLLAWVERPSDAPEPRIVVASIAEQRRSDLVAGTDLLRPPYGGLTFTGAEHLAWGRSETQAGLSVGQILEQRLDTATLELTGAPRSLTPLEPGVPTQLEASADGLHIAFARMRPQVDYRVAAILGDGSLGAAQTTTSDTSDEHVMGWSPQGEVLFLSARSGAVASYARSLVDGSVRELGAVRSVQVLRNDGPDVILLERPEDPANASMVVRVSPTGERSAIGSVASPPFDRVTSCALDRCTFASWEGGEVVIRDLAWPSPRPDVLARIRLSTTNAPYVIAWSMAPDATRGALVDEGSVVHIVGLTEPGTRAIALPPNPGDLAPMAQYTTWSADGKSLYVTGMHMEGSVYAIAQVRMDGSVKVVHREANRWIHNPFVSPDGAQLAFATHNLSGQIWVLER